MTDLATRVSGPDGVGALIPIRGRGTRAEAIERYRAYWTNRLNEAQAALAIADDDLRVTIVRGVVVQHHVADVWPDAPGDQHTST